MAKLPFDEARKVTASLGLRNQTQFYALSKEGRRPNGIPSNPREAYRSEWLGWAYWLGTGPADEGSRPMSQVPFVAFESGRELAHSLRFRNQTQWYEWVKGVERPANIPADPSKAYKGRGWAGWPDWFGNKPARATGNESVLPFHEARLFARNLGLKGHRAWRAYADSPERPASIPKTPESRYADEGWIGWGDWLGHHTRWNHQSIVAFLQDLKPILGHLQPVELYLILRQNGMLRLDRRNVNAKVIGQIRRLCSVENAGVELDTITGILEESQVDGPEDGSNRGDGPEGGEAQDGSEGDGAEGGSSSPRRGNIEEFAAVDSRNSDDDPDGFRWMKNRDSLKAADALADAHLVDDTEILDFLVENRVAGLWQKAISPKSDFDPEAIRSEMGGVYFNLIRSRFFERSRSQGGVAVRQS